MAAPPILTRSEKKKASVAERTAQSMIDTIDRYFDTVDNGDVTGTLAELTADCVISVITDGVSHEGRDEGRVIFSKEATPSARRNDNDRRTPARRTTAPKKDPRPALTSLPRGSFVEERT